MVKQAFYLGEVVLVCMCLGLLGSRPFITSGVGGEELQHHHCHPL
jgi:hypothetical protein